MITDKHQHLITDNDQHLIADKQQHLITDKHRHLITDKDQHLITDKHRHLITDKHRHLITNKHQHQSKPDIIRILIPSPNKVSPDSNVNTHHQHHKALRLREDRKEEPIPTEHRTSTAKTKPSASTKDTEHKITVTLLFSKISKI